MAQTNESAADDWPVFMGELGCCIALFQAGPDVARAGSRESFHVAFMVGREDFDQAQHHLRAHGVYFAFEDHGSSHSIYFADPDGYRLELTTYEL